MIEPAAFGVARGDAAVEKLLEGLVPLYQAASTITPEQFDRRFDAALGLDHPPEPLNEESRTVVEANMRERPPWEAEIRLDDLAGAPFPSLVVSGGWNSAFDAVCTVLARTLNADRRAAAATASSMPGVSTSGSKHFGAWGDVRAETQRAAYRSPRYEPRFDDYRHGQRRQTEPFRKWD